MTEQIDINCRQVPEGGDIDALRAWMSVPALRGKLHVIVLIHGYNDTFEDGASAYESFSNLQSGLVSEGSDWAFGATLLRLFWPGDAKWGILRPAFYPWALPVADKTADLLAEIIKDLAIFAGGRLTIDFVAHSMGNRVAMRMLSLISDVQGINVRRSVHMAAAIPVRRIEDPADELRLGLQVEFLGGLVESMYSHADSVLAYAFPVGETAAFAEEGVLPVALGHSDWAHGSSYPGFSQWDAGPAGHGDYWSGKAIQTRVCRILDLGVASSSVLSTHDTEQSPELASTELLSRTTQVRKVGQSIEEM